MSATLLPFMVFLARVTDVTMGTIRHISIVRGKKILVFSLAFVEMIIWVIAIGSLLKNLSNIATIVAFAGGVATGNLLGMILEEKLIMGKLVVRVFITGAADPLVKAIHDRGYGVTTMDAHGSSGPVKILYIVINRQDLADLSGHIEDLSPKAFYTVEDIRSAKEGFYRARP